MKITKEQLAKENAQLREQLSVERQKDVATRENLSDILGHYRIDTNFGATTRTRTMTWLDIAFRIGELRAETNFSRLLESNEQMSLEIKLLKEQGEKKEM